MGFSNSSGSPSAAESLAAKMCACATERTRELEIPATTGRADLVEDTGTVSVVKVPALDVDDKRDCRCILIKLAPLDLSNIQGSDVSRNITHSWANTPAWRFTKWVNAGEDRNVSVNTQCVRVTSCVAVIKARENRNQRTRHATRCMKTERERETEPWPFLSRRSATRIRTLHTFIRIIHTYIRISREMQAYSGLATTRTFPHRDYTHSLGDFYLYPVATGARRYLARSLVQCTYFG